MRIIFILGVFLSTFVAFCQEDFNYFVGLSPKDSVTFPKNMKEYIDINHVSNSLVNKSIKNKDKSFYIKNLINSGYISFGDHLSNYIQSLLDNLIDSNHLTDTIDIVIVKSNLASSFNDSKNIIFITTGLIAQTINEDQIVFYLARELNHIQSKHEINLTKSNDFSNHINNLVEVLSNYSIEQEILSDSIGLKLFSATNLNEGNLKNAIDVFYLSHLPYEDFVFDAAYFNRNNFFIPNEIILGEKSLFLNEFKSQPKKFGVDQDKRIQLFRKQIDTYSSTNSSNSIYSFSINLARFDLLQTDILANQYLKNLYHIYILEKDFPDSYYLKLMKAHSWYGILHQKIDNTIYPIDKSVFFHKGESIFFQYFLFRQNIYGIIANTLRITYDLATEYPTDKKIMLLYEKTIQTIANINYVDLNKFHELNFTQTKTLINNSIDKNKYEKNEGLSKQTLILDTISYYLYCIPDIVKNEDFKNKYTVYKNKTFEQEVFTSKTIEIPFYQFNYYKKNKIDLGKSLAIAHTINQEKTFLNVSIKEQNNQNYTVKDFNKIGSFKRCFDYIETFKNNKQDVVLIDLNLTSNNNSNNISLIPIYEGLYKPHLKSYHILSFILIPIIATTNDFFLNGFKSNYKTLILNNVNGSIIYYKNTNNRLTVNKLNVLNYLYNIRNNS